VRFVLDIGGKDVEIMDIGGKARRDRRAGRICPFATSRADPAVSPPHARKAMRADDLAALAERMHMAIDGGHGIELGALDAEQLKWIGRKYSPTM